MNINFFIDSVENRGTSFAHKLENLGNQCLRPLSSYRQGRRFVLIEASNRWDSGSGQDDYFIKRVKAPALRIMTLIPGLLLGVALKGLAYLSAEVRLRNRAVHLATQDAAGTSRDPFYREMTRRLHNRGALEIKLDGLSAEKVNELERELRVGNWGAAIFDEAEYPYYALELLRQGRVTSQQFGTVQQFWSATQTHGVKPEVISLFDRDGRVNPTARDYIAKTLPLQKEAREGKLNTAVNFFDPNLLDSYFEAMRRAPVSEQVLFIVPDNQRRWTFDPTRDVGKTYFNHTISQEIRHSTGINALARVADSRIVPPLGVMQTFLNVFYEDNAVYLNPVLGLSSLKDIRHNGLNDCRDMAIPFPGITLPDRADGFWAPSYDFTYHDFYHAITASQMPRGDRRKMIQVADAINRLQKQVYFGKRDLQGLRDRFIDLEDSSYRKDALTTLKGDSLFWQAVTSTELLYSLVESSRGRYLIWYPAKRYHAAVIMAMKPNKDAVVAARDAFHQAMDSQIKDLAQRNYFLGGTFQEHMELAFLKATRDNHPINAYAALA